MRIPSQRRVLKARPDWFFCLIGSQLKHTSIYDSGKWTIWVLVVHKSKLHLFADCTMLRADPLRSFSNSLGGTAVVALNNDGGYTWSGDRSPDIIKYFSAKKLPMHVRTVFVLWLMSRIHASSHRHGHFLGIVLFCYLSSEMVSKCIPGYIAEYEYAPLAAADGLWLYKIGY